MVLLFRKSKKIQKRWNTGVNPTKLYFFVNEEFFCFLLLSLAVL